MESPQLENNSSLFDRNINVTSIKRPTSSVEIKHKEDPRCTQCERKKKKHTHMLVKQDKVEIFPLNKKLKN